MNIKLLAVDVTLGLTTHAQVGSDVNFFGYSPGDFGGYWNRKPSCIQSNAI